MFLCSGTEGWEIAPSEASNPPKFEYEFRVMTVIDSTADGAIHFYEPVAYITAKNKATINADTRSTKTIDLSGMLD